MKNINLLFGLFFVLALFACEPQQEDDITLPPAPENVTFSIEAGTEPNTYILTNTTTDVFEYAWDLGNGTTATGESVEAFYSLAGTYEVSLTVLGKGGSGSATQTIIVEADAPFMCEGNEVAEFLSNCDQKVWKLNDEAGALFVGPGDGVTTWFATTEEDIETRFCQFDDTWTFTGDLEMIYETNGDIWGEDYLGFNFECVDESQLGDAVAPWGSGTHTYVIEGDSPPQLTVSGLGAFIGLPKVANGAEVTTPQTAVTYDVIRMESTPEKDIIELEVNFGPGIWRFTLASFN